MTPAYCNGAIAGRIEHPDVFHRPGDCPLCEAMAQLRALADVAQDLRAALVKSVAQTEAVLDRAQRAADAAEREVTK